VSAGSGCITIDSFAIAARGFLDISLLKQTIEFPLVNHLSNDVPLLVLAMCFLGRAALTSA